MIYPVVLSLGVPLRTDKTSTERGIQGGNPLYNAVGDAYHDGCDLFVTRRRRTMKRTEGYTGAFDGE